MVYNFITQAKITTRPTFSDIQRTTDICCVVCHEIYLNIKRAVLNAWNDKKPLSVGGQIYTQNKFQQLFGLLFGGTLKYVD